MDYQFKPLGKKCAGTGAELPPGSVCYSVLVEEAGELVRLDYSKEGWKGPPPGAFGTWQTTVPRRAEVKRAPLDPAALLTCFEQMTEEANPAQEKLRYILALLLLQKKQLRLEGSRQEGEEEYLQLAGSQGGAYEVRELQLTDDELQELQQQLTAHLMAEWGVTEESPENLAS